jgi:hypothetical protein
MGFTKRVGRGHCRTFPGRRSNLAGVAIRVTLSWRRMNSMNGYAVAAGRLACQGEENHRFVG